MTDLYLRRVKGGAVPADEMTNDLFQSISYGAILKAKAPKDGARILRQRRLYWGLLQEIYPNTERWHTAQALHVAIRIALGYCDLVELTDGRIVPHPHSTSVEAMSAAEFHQFLKRVIDLIVTVILPGVNKADLEARILEMVGG